MACTLHRYRTASVLLVSVSSSQMLHSWATARRSSRHCVVPDLSNSWQSTHDTSFRSLICACFPCTSTAVLATGVQAGQPPLCDPGRDMGHCWSNRHPGGCTQHTGAFVRMQGGLVPINEQTHVCLHCMHRLSKTIPSVVLCNGSYRFHSSGVFELQMVSLVFVRAGHFGFCSSEEHPARATRGADNCTGCRARRVQLLHVPHAAGVCTVQIDEIVCRQLQDAI